MGGWEKVFMPIGGIRIINNLCIKSWAQIALPITEIVMR